jgi:hypothetical protein
MVGVAPVLCGIGHQEVARILDQRVAVERRQLLLELRPEVRIDVEIALHDVIGVLVMAAVVSLDRSEVIAPHDLAAHAVTERMSHYLRQGRPFGRCRDAHQKQKRRVPDLQPSKLCESKVPLIVENKTPFQRLGSSSRSNTLRIVRKRLQLHREVAL